MHLSIILGSMESNLSVKVLNEYWDVVGKLDDKLAHHGVKRDLKAPIAHKHLRQKVYSG